MGGFRVRLRYSQRENVNTSNIVFLKSTDDSMLDTLEKMSGKTHIARKNSKTVTRDMEKLMLQNEGKVSYTMQLQEEPVIKYNDMAFIPERNSIVFRAGDSPIWNRNETILPMSWRLFKNTIVHPGHEYSLQTIPTLSSVLDFDVRQNQPDFGKMLDKRMAQACLSEKVQAAYQDAYEYSDYEISRLDIDVYAQEIMENINLQRAKEAAKASDEEDIDEILAMTSGNFYENAEDNSEEQQQAIREAEEKFNISTELKFARGTLSPSNLIGLGGFINHAMDKIFISAYIECRGDMEQDSECFSVIDGNLCSRDGTVYIRHLNETEALERLNEEAKKKDSNVFSEGDITEAELNKFGSYEVTGAFYKFLADCDRWSFARGRFDDAVFRLIQDET